jgi:hypothetical protein
MHTDIRGKGIEGKYFVFGLKFALYSRMKKLLLLVFLPFISYAQEIGIKAGPSYTISSGNLQDDYGKGKFFFNAGVYTREDMGKVNFVFEAFYNQVNISKSGTEFKLHTGNAAFFLQSRGKFGVFIGPTAVFNLSKSVTPLEEYQSSIIPVNIDATIGLNLDLSDRVGLNARYTYALFESIEDTKYHPQSVQLSVNYMIKRF